jgi:ABC-2 type transport system permease protein
MSENGTVFPSRPFLWSVRREIWENRSVYIAPLVVAGVVLFATFAGAWAMPKKMQRLSADPAARHLMITRPFSMAPAPIMLVTIIVGAFYSIDALYGERRDRSILFWKSMPVSDATTVLSKASIPMLVLPSIAFVLGVVAMFTLLVLVSGILVMTGHSPAPLWIETNFMQEPLIMLYGLAVHTLWFAPIYAYLLLVSAWARRTPILWAVIPLLAISVVERIAFNTKTFMAMLQYRVGGAMREAFAFKITGGHEALEQITQLTPARYLTRPGLWLGLLFAAACLVAAVRLRRYREPI